MHQNNYVLMVGFYSGGLHGYGAITYQVVARRSCKDSDVQGQDWAISRNSPVKGHSLGGRRLGRSQ